MLNLFKINKKDTRTTWLSDFTNCSGVSVFDFEQVNTSQNKPILSQDSKLVQKGLAFMIFLLKSCL